MNSRSERGNLRPVPGLSSFPSLARRSLACALLCVWGCDSSDAPPPAPREESAPQRAAEETGPAVVHVPVGKYRSGSLPAESGRRPDREPLVQELELGPYRIDARPYPGDGSPPKLGVSRDEAEALCAARQGRLCTELEWERACKGPMSTTYPGGDAPCDQPEGCASGFDVLELGRLPEWTASRFGPGVSWENQAVVRGALLDARAEERRCARRTPESEVKSSELGFRCCYGAPNALVAHEPTLGPAYQEVELSLEELTSLLKSDPRTAGWAEKVTFFKSPDAEKTVFERGPRETMGFTLTTRPLEWQPERGTRLLVVAARSGDKTSFVVVYHVTPDRKLLAGSFLMKNEQGPVALAYSPSIRPRVHFSTCWGCPGETGKVLFRAPEELVLLQP